MPDINLQYLPPTDGLTHPLAPRYASWAHFARSPGFFPGFVSNYFFRDSIHLPQNLEGCRNLQLLDFFSYPPNRLPVPGDLPGTAIFLYHVLFLVIRRPVIFLSLNSSFVDVFSMTAHLPQRRVTCLLSPSSTCIPPLS